jgi:ORF6N domain
MAVAKAALGKVEDITRAILVLRGRRVLLDAELAVLYGVTTRRLNEQVRRNRKRFPNDFLFELTTEEFANLKSRFATSSWGGRRKRPLAFTEHRAIQAATILNSPRAVEMSVYVVRAFVKLREVLSTNRELARRFQQLELRLDNKLTEHDEAIAAILSAIRELMRPRDPPRRGIGFTAKLADDS